MVARCHNCKQPQAGHPGRTGHYCTNFLAKGQKFHVDQDVFRVESKDEILTINRNTKVINVRNKQEEGGDAEGGGINIVGIVGFIDFISGPFLILAKDKMDIGKVAGMEISQVREFQIYPFRSDNDLDETQRQSQRRLCDLVLEEFSRKEFYFSPNADLSHTRQRVDKLRSPDFLQQSLIQRCDRQFAFNHFLLTDFHSHDNDITIKIHRFALVLCHGFMSVETLEVDGRHLGLALLARRSSERAGPRLHFRGTDQAGHVANFVETEQLLERDGLLASFEQIRGSIPLLWSQRPTLRPNPPPVPDEEIDHIPAFTQHLNRMVQKYGFLSLLNLVNQQGAEGTLEAMFRDAVETVKRNEPELTNAVRYVHLDFHKECAKGSDRLNILLDRLNQDEYGYFLQSREGKNQARTLARQTGVIRTNCIDCLDRTNVAQWLVARRNLQAMVVRLGVPGVLDTQEFDEKVRLVWVKHGDVLSMQTSGSGAIKTELTRTGQNLSVGTISLRGWFEDKRRSIIRHYQNNFEDGRHTDALDLIMGKYRVAEGANNTPPAGKQLTKWLQILLHTLFVALFVAMILTLIIPSELSPWITLSTMGCSLVFLVFVILMLGPDKPTLRPDLH